MPRRATILALLLLAPGALAAQGTAHPLVGTWAVTIPAGMRVEGGVATPITATGTLAVVAQGDSLIGTLTTDPIEGRPALPPRRLAAKAATPAVFTSISKAKINVNGTESERNARSTYTVTATGDALSGSVERTIEGDDVMPMGGAQPMSGTRVKPAG